MLHSVNQILHCKNSLQYHAKPVTTIGVIIVFFFLFAIFIFHSRESRLHRYILNGSSALAWELPFPICLGHLSSTLRWRRFVLVLCPRTQQANLPPCSPQHLLTAERQAGKLWIPFLKVFWYDSTRRLNPRSTDCEADALTTTPLLICERCYYSNYQ